MLFFIVNQEGKPTILGLEEISLVDEQGGLHPMEVVMPNQHELKVWSAELSKVHKLSKEFSVKNGARMTVFPFMGKNIKAIRTPRSEIPLYRVNAVSDICNDKYENFFYAGNYSILASSGDNDDNDVVMLYNKTLNGFTFANKAIQERCNKNAPVKLNTFIDWQGIVVQTMAPVVTCEYETINLTNGLKGDFSQENINSEVFKILCEAHPWLKDTHTSKVRKLTKSKIEIYENLCKTILSLSFMPKSVVGVDEINLYTREESRTSTYLVVSLKLGNGKRGICSIFLDIDPSLRFTTETEDAIAYELSEQFVSDVYSILGGLVSTRFKHLKDKPIEFANFSKNSIKIQYWDEMKLLLSK